MMSFPGPASGAIFSANPGYVTITFYKCSSDWIIYAIMTFYAPLFLGVALGWIISPLDSIIA